jgi:hypothetical protein
MLTLMLDVATRKLFLQIQVHQSRFSEVQFRKDLFSLVVATKQTVRSQVLTAASMKFRVFWDALPCSQIDVDRRFRGAYCLHQQGDE